MVEALEEQPRRRARDRAARRLRQLAQRVGGAGVRAGGGERGAQAPRLLEHDEPEPLDLRRPQLNRLLRLLRVVAAGVVAAAVGVAAVLVAHAHKRVADGVEVEAGVGQPEARTFAPQQRPHLRREERLVGFGVRSDGLLDELVAWQLL